MRYRMQRVRSKARVLTAAVALFACCEAGKSNLALYRCMH
jgi:hypothetical protein